MTSLACDPAASPTGRLVTPRFARLLVMTFGSGLSMYLLTSVVPVYLAANGSGGIGAGLSTGAMMFAAVAVELLVPAMLKRFGYRGTLALGLVLLGAPSIALIFTASLPLVLAVCVVRGAGLAIMVVGAVALVAELTPAGRRGEGLGVYGVVVGLPAAVGLPLGVYLTGVVGFEVLFVLAAACSLAGLAALPTMPGRVVVPSGDEEQHVRVLGGLRGSGLLMPTWVFAAVTVAAGISVTFLPLASGNHLMVAAALLIQSVTAPGARWLAGRLGDRVGPDRLLVPALLLAALGAGSLVFVGTPAAVVIGAAFFGTGFGAAQNLTLAIMYDRVPRSRYGQVSALWNLAYDAGWGAGAILFGFVVAGVGYPTAFALTAAVVALAVVPAARARRFA
ncbi:major facilitator superfamily MFS_1 [Kribbella flavida DSM 17836]|uniref:Major facilitator superfamily MFS_1 n=1 Tax=Kribbella flavida (strain DSM 17836 / JCM 10339 / NBRC 14399) TaxID=479435 RepID=D2PT01_KRIFD|nr:MFS transporter [Kribbella flavida]ADB35053.1 major facilitator superfamily MFS_1 [Kribbella flavida DSM 17836]